MNTAERIYSASTSEDAGNARLAERLARLIEDDIASSKVAAGSGLGSVKELCERYQAGRAAVREGIGLLERRGLGRLRPGPLGGFIVEQPDTASMGDELADYFRIITVTSGQLSDAREAIDLMGAGMAATAAQPSALLPCMSTANMLDWHLNTRTGLALRSGNSALPLFAACLNALTREFADDLPPALPSNCALNARDKLRRQLSQALRDRSADDAMQVTAALHTELVALLPHGATTLPLPKIGTDRLDNDRTLATLVARKIAAEILTTSYDGQKLGSEWELCDRFSVSRATLRQSIRQLQDMGLVESRRGRGNGLVARDLSGTGGIRLVLAFLISHQMDPKSAGTVLFQLNRYVPAFAVFRASSQQREALQTQLNRVQNGDQLDRFELLRLVQLVSRLSDSPIIDFFSRSLAAYEARFHPSLATQLSHSLQREYFDMLQKLLNTVKRQDQGTFDWAKAESSKVMMEMSRSRPI